MPALFIYLFKVNIALVLFCLGYYLVLRHLTFYTLNRIYLVVAILFSTLYPQINLSDFLQRHQQLTEPVQAVILNWKAPAENFVKPLYQPDYWKWVELIFWAGVTFLAIRLLMQLFSLYKLYKNSTPNNIQDHAVRVISDNISPFSFWRSIYINTSNLSATELKNVLEHEQVHVNQWHTLDILLAELSTIFYWFNPGVWLMKKAVRENIEFITDRNILQKGADSKQYQYSLVSVSLATSSNTIVNHFNISTIKKRIIMMNTKRSAGYNLTRYVFLVPAVIALLLIFSLSKAAISKKSLHAIKSIATAVSNISINHSKPPVIFVKAKKIAATARVKQPDTIYLGKSNSKDGKNKSFLLTSDQKADSVNYVINGAKSTKAELRAMDPARILSLELVPANKAKEFFPELNNDHEVLFITTEDSETGKKLKRKMDEKFGGGMLANAKNMSVRGYGRSSGNTPIGLDPDISVITNESSDNAPMTSSTSISTNGSSDDEPVVLQSGNGVKTSVVVIADAKAFAKTQTTVKKNVHVTINPVGKVVLNDVTVDIPDEINLDSTSRIGANVYAFNTNKLNKIYKVTTTGYVNSIDGFSNKLIVIDGKEATKTDLKKLSVSDIKSLTEKVDEKTKNKYGDKAKNGVLFITTKKSD
jgi:bla regulator protein BlaR1